MEWFYANERDEQIKVEEDELRTLVNGGSVRPDTLVWNGEMPEWKPCSQVKPEWFASAAGSGLASGSVAIPVGSPYSVAASSPALPRSVVIGPPTDGLALASMICGIAGLLFMFCYGAGLPISIAAVICGHLCRRRLLSEGNTSSAGLAMAGIVTGYIGIGLIVFVVGIFVIFFGFAAAVSSTTPVP